MRKALAMGLWVLLLTAAIGLPASTGNAEGSPIVGPTGHLYQRIDSDMPWHEARDYCAALGAHLVTIGSLEENQFVYGLTSWGWLGATDQVTEGEWEWVTGEPWAFEYWASGEPNNCAGPGCIPEHYLTFRQDGSSQWNDEPASAHDFVCEWDIRIDIKPGSYPNSINLRSKGLVPVAVLTSEGFDAGIVDPTTVQFADAYPRCWVMQDVDCDGDVDLLFHFETQGLNLDAESTEATLIGMTFGGVPIQATDTVKIVP